jgi:hypothetical protein
MGIAQSSMLVELNVSTWGASKLDRDVTNTTNITNNASDDASKVYKNLAAGSTLVSDIGKYAARVRLYHNTVTMPWATKGARLLPTSLFFEYKQTMNNHRTTFESMVTKLVQDYPNIVATAQRRLNGMYKAEDYPTVEQIQQKYGFNLVFSPLAESGDFRLDVSANDLRELALSYEADFNKRLSDAVRKPWQDLHDQLLSISEKLKEVKDENGEAGKKRYYDSLLSNPAELCDLLKHLNVTKDPQLEAARLDLEKAIFGVEMEDLREYEHVRADVKSKVDAIINKYSGGW